MLINNNTLILVLIWLDSFLLSKRFIFYFREVFKGAKSVLVLGKSISSSKKIGNEVLNCLKRLFCAIGRRFVLIEAASIRFITENRFLP